MSVEPNAAAGRRRPTLLFIFIPTAVVVLAVAVVALVLFSGAGGSEVADEFDQEVTAFEEELATLRAQVDENLGSQSSGFGIGPAAELLRDIEALCSGFQETLRGMDIPDHALDSRDRLLDLLEAYKVMATNAAAAFTPAAAQSLVALGARVDAEWPAAVEALRADLA